MSKTTPNPVADSYDPSNAPRISQRTYHIAGITTTVHGLAELPQDASSIACLWLLHPRLQRQESMSPFAAHIIRDWNGQQSSSKNSPGLIAVSFDQRNHGSRLVSGVANEAWRSGNPRHALDMFSIYQGTAVDTSLLLDYLPSYLFPRGERTVTEHLVLGISLGGHAAWQVLLADPRVSAAIVVIGCPDYTRLMTDRARLSKLTTYTTTNPPGSGFLGSEDFPPGLLDAVARHDPAGLLWGQLTTRRAGQEHLSPVTDQDKEKLIPVMARTLGNKRILNLSGGADKLVPYHCSKPFLDWLKSAIAPGGWYEGGGVHLEDIVVPNCGHEVPPIMVKEMVRFVIQTLNSEKVMTVGKRSRM